MSKKRRRDDFDMRIIRGITAVPCALVATAVILVAIAVLDAACGWGIVRGNGLLVTMMTQ